MITRERQHGATEIREGGLVTTSRVRRHSLDHERLDCQAARLSESRPFGELSAGKANLDSLGCDFAFGGHLRDLPKEHGDIVALAARIGEALP